LQDPEEKTGFLKSRAIRNIINKVWFKVTQRTKAEGIVLQGHYDPFPLVALAITLAAVSVSVGSNSHALLIAPTG
jgi:Domain of unknown function (DUF6532)